jgi:hypothetical protein
MLTNIYKYTKVDAVVLIRMGKCHEQARQK